MNFQAELMRSWCCHGQPLDAVALVRSEDFTEQARLSEVSTFWSNVDQQQVSLDSALSRGIRVLFATRD